MVALSKTLRALFLGVALISLMITCASYVFLSELRRPAGTATEPVELVVEPGDTTSAIATKLRAEGLIRQPLLFTSLVRSQGLDGSLQAGTYTLSPEMTMSEIIAALQTNVIMEDIAIRTIEGMRLEEIAEVVDRAALVNVDRQAFLDVARNGEAFKAQYFLLQDLPPGASLEGYLFPDTYRLRPTATPEEVVTVMLNRFVEQYEQIETQVRVEGASVHDIVTMASIVQREAARQDEMPQISAVFWNRLKDEFRDETGGGRLQADPTLQYVLGEPGEWWPKLDNLTLEEIQGNTDPYNTRVVIGLPPGPISNPGFDALRAAAQPDETAPYLYFVAACGQPGVHNFATSLEEFQRFEAEYLACDAQTD